MEEINNKNNQTQNNFINKDSNIDSFFNQIMSDVNNYEDESYINTIIKN